MKSKITIYYRLKINKIRCIEAYIKENVKYLLLEENGGGSGNRLRKIIFDCLVRVVTDSSCKSRIT